MNHRRRAAALAALSLALILAFLSGLSDLSSSLFAQAPPEGSADIVVDFGDGRVKVARLPVISGTSGLDALEATDLAVELSGGLVCRIDGVGCPASNCFCSCQDLDDCRFWGYFHAEPDGSWVAGETGAGEHLLSPGAVDGWVWSRPAPAPAPAPLRAGILATQWLSHFQEPSGALGGEVGFTAEAIFAARGAGIPLDMLRSQADRSMVDYLATASGAYAEISAAAAGKALAGAVAAGLDPEDVGGANLVAQVQDRYDDTTGWYGASIWDQAWAMLGLAAAGEPIPRGAVAALDSAAATGGGWGGAAKAEVADVDSTALVLQAMAAWGLGPEDWSVEPALAWLETMRQPGGGFAHDDPAGPANVNATGMALQALLALGLDPAAERWSSNGISPLGYLTGTQQVDGRLQFGKEPVDVSDLVATLQAAPAITGRSLPLGGYRASIRAAEPWLREQRTPEGGFEGFNPGATIDAVIALAAAGRSAADLGQPNSGPVPAPESYLASIAADYATKGPSAAGKLATGVAALGEDPRDFGGQDLVDVLYASFDPVSGNFGTGGTWDQAWAILGLTAAEAEIPAQAITATLAAAVASGGWGFEAGAEEADADSTGLALQALAAAGVGSDHHTTWLALNYLFETQGQDGGWGYGGETSASSTALVVGGLAAMGQAIDGAGWMRGEAGAQRHQTPRDAILAMQAASGGFAGFSGPEDPSASYGAVLGLSARPLPIRVDRQSAPIVYLPFLTRNR